MSEVVCKMVIDPRFSGPPGLGNGGYAAGALAQVVGGAASVTLRAPIPLDTPLDLTASGVPRRGIGAAPAGAVDGRGAVSLHAGGEERDASRRTEEAGSDTGRTAKGARKPAAGGRASAGGRIAVDEADGVGARDGAHGVADGRANGGSGGASRVELRHAGALIAEAEPAALDLALPPAPDRAVAVAATGRYPGRAPGPYQECFVCGFAREPGSGLRVFAGPTGTPGLVAADWTVHPALADEDGAVPEEFLWGALDCPGAYAIGGARPRDLRLGRMTARVSGRVRPGERCTVAGWRLGSERRKHFTGTAVYGEAGNVVAAAASIWIEPRTEGAGPQSPARSGTAENQGESR